MLKTLFPFVSIECKLLQNIMVKLIVLTIVETHGKLLFYGQLSVILSITYSIYYIHWIINCKYQIAINLSKSEISYLIKR